MSHGGLILAFVEPTVGAGMEATLCMFKYLKGINHQGVNRLLLSNHYSNSPKVEVAYRSINRGRVVRSEYHSALKRKTS